eukprot:753480-Prorocentrum_minimum.AAC.3
MEKPILPALRSALFELFVQPAISPCVVNAVSRLPYCYGVKYANSPLRNGNSDHARLRVWVEPECFNGGAYRMDPYSKFAVGLVLHGWVPATRPQPARFSGACALRFPCSSLGLKDVTRDEAALHLSLEVLEVAEFGVLHVGH